MRTGQIGHDEEAAADEVIQLRQLSKATDLLKEKARSFMRDMQESGMSLRIDRVDLPHGHMPPYLVKEPKPQATRLWDSGLEALPAQ